MDGVVVSLERGEMTAVGAPQPDRLVAGAGGQHATVGRPSHTPYETPVPLQRGEVLSFGAPQPDRGVVRAGGEHATVRRPRHTIDGFVVSRERGDAPAVG